MIAPIMQIDTRGIEGMFRDLSRMSGRDFADITRIQAGKVLETAIRYTPSAKLKVVKETASRSIRRRFNTYGAGESGSAARNQYPRISISPRKNRVWWIDKSEDGKRTFYLMNGDKRWSDDRWGQYLAEENDRIQDMKAAIVTADKRAVAAIGLAKQSWVQIADSLRIMLKLTSEGRVRSARPSNSLMYQNGRGEETVGQNTFFIDLINSYPILIAKLNGAGILRRAISARVRAFQIDMQKGVFDDISLRAKRWPGIYVT